MAHDMDGRATILWPLSQYSCGSSRKGPSPRSGLGPSCTSQDALADPTIPRSITYSFLSRPATLKNGPLPARGVVALQFRPVSIGYGMPPEPATAPVRGEVVVSITDLFVIPVEAVDRMREATDQVDRLP